MGRRVLVEQRVVVDATGLADARGGVDERRLAQPPPHPVGVDEGGDEVAIVVRVGLEPDEPAVGELAAEPMNQPAAERERERAAERPVRPARIRAREHLLGRDIRGEFPAVDQRLEATEPARALDVAEFELGAGPPQLEPGQAELRQPCRPAGERAQVVAPAARPLSVFVCETAEVDEVAGQLALCLQRFELGIDLTGPVIGRPGGDRPARLHVQLCPAQEAQLLRYPRVVGRDPLGRYAVQVTGLSLAGDGGESAVGARDLPEAAARPRRERAERVVAAVQQPSAHHERVRRDDVHELRPRAVGGFGDRDEQLPVLRLALGDEGVAVARARSAEFALERREAHLRAEDLEDVVAVVVVAEAVLALQRDRTGSALVARLRTGSEHLVRRVVAVERERVGRAVGPAVLGTEQSVRAEPELSPGHDHGAVDGRVVRGLVGEVAVHIPGRAQVDLAVVVEVLPRDDARSLIADGRIDRNRDGPVGRDRLVDELARRTDR